MIYKLNVTYDPQEALEYFEGLQQHYSNMSWDLVKDHNDPDVIDPKNNLHNIYGWGLQTIFNDLDFPFHSDIDPHNEGPDSFKNTKLVHGFAEKVLSTFNKPFRSFLMSFPPGSYIGPRFPHNPRHVEIIVPIITNSKFKFKMGNEQEQVYDNIEPGTMLMIDFPYKVSHYNEGDSNVVGIIFKVLYEYKDEILKMNERL